MSNPKELDEIEVVDIEEYACSGKPIPKRVKYYLIKVDEKKLRVQSPIMAREVLISADLDTSDYSLEQKYRGGKTVGLELDQPIDLREPGIERFVTVLTRETKIIVNGKEITVEVKKLSFEELVKLAFETPPTGTDICFTITYRNGPKQNPDGILGKGEKVRIKNRMIFNVTATDKS